MDCGVEMGSMVSPLALVITMCNEKYCSSCGRETRLICTGCEFEVGECRCDNPIVRSEEERNQSLV